MTQRQSSRGFAMLAAGAAVAALAANLVMVFLTGAASGGKASAEAIVRSCIAFELAGPDSRGYHALINSSLMAPLPTLAAAPFVWLGRGDSALGFYALTSILSAAAAAYLLALARRMGAPWAVGAALAVALLFNPWTPLSAWRGTSATGTLLFATAICAHFVSWLRRGRLMSLGVAANLLAFATIWDPRFLPAVLVGGAIVAGHAYALRRRLGGEAAPPEEGAPQAKGAPPGASAQSEPKRFLEGLLIVYLAPALYVPAVWVLFNWLIFGDPWRLARDLGPFARIVELSFAAAAALALVFYALARMTRHAHWAVGAAFLCCAGGLAWLTALPPSQAMAAINGQAPTTQSERRDIENLKRYLRETQGGRLILVVGRPGYLLRQWIDSDGLFIHRLNLNIESALQDTPGRELLMVLSAPQVELYRAQFGAERWRRHFLDDEQFGQWQVFYCVRTAAGTTTVK